MLFQLEIYIKFSLCAAAFLTCSNFWFLHQMNAAPPHQIFLQTLLRCYFQWRVFLLPVFKHELQSLRFGAVCRERRHSKLVIAALWGFFLHRHKMRELSCSVYIMERSQCLEGEGKTENVGAQFRHKHFLELVFSRSLHQLIISHSTSFSFMLAQFIPWGRVCTFGKYDEWVNSHLCPQCLPGTHTHTHTRTHKGCSHLPCRHVCFVLCRPPFCV